MGRPKHPLPSRPSRAALRMWQYPATTLPCKRWQGGTGKSIDWTLYDEMDYVAHKLFNKR